MTPSIELTCRECDTAFAYTQAEQEFRESRGLTQPELCPACRGQERSRRNGDLISLYQRAETFDPILLQGDGHQRNGGYNRGRAEHRTQYTAICAACGAETRVPFVPKGDRPVYCRACFNARRGR
jgi:CxxC-x17-CxxC domain-containing protein